MAVNPDVIVVGCTSGTLSKASVMIREAYRKNYQPHGCCNHHNFSSSNRGPEIIESHEVCSSYSLRR